MYFQGSLVVDAVNMNVQKVTSGNSILVNYSYLADGTKTRAMDAAGEGLLYLGSLIYRKERSSQSLRPVQPLQVQREGGADDRRHRPDGLRSEILRPRHLIID